MFAVPRTFPALVRFSNGDSHINRDRKHEPRGIAIKLIGVEGRKLLPGHEDDVTQDFLATSHSVTSAVSDVTQFIAFVKAQRGGLIGLFPKLCRALGWSEATRISAALFRTVILSRVRSMATEHFSGTAPIQCGPYAVKFTVRPAEGTVATTARPLWGRDFLRKELADRLRKADLIMDFWFSSTSIATARRSRTPRSLGGPKTRRCARSRNCASRAAIWTTHNPAAQREDR